MLVRIMWFGEESFLWFIMCKRKEQDIGWKSLSMDSHPVDVDSEIQ